MFSLKISLWSLNCYYPKPVLTLGKFQTGCMFGVGICSFVSSVSDWLHVLQGNLLLCSVCFRLAACFARESAPFVLSVSDWLHVWHGDVFPLFCLFQTGYMFGKGICFLCFVRFRLAVCLARESTFFVSCVSDWLHVWQGNLLCRHGVQVRQLLPYIKVRSRGRLAAL